MLFFQDLSQDGMAAGMEGGGDESFNSMSPDDSAKSSPDGMSPDKSMMSDSQESQEDNSPQKKSKKPAHRKKKREDRKESMLCLCLLAHVDFLFISRDHYQDRLCRI